MSLCQSLEKARCNASQSASVNLGLPLEIHKGKISTQTEAITVRKEEKAELRDHTMASQWESTLKTELEAGCISCIKNMDFLTSHARMWCLLFSRFHERQLGLCFWRNKQQVLKQWWCDRKETMCHCITGCHGHHLLQMISKCLGNSKCQENALVIRQRACGRRPTARREADVVLSICCVSTSLTLTAILTWQPASVYPKLLHFHTFRVYPITQAAESTAGSGIPHFWTLAPNRVEPTVSRQWTADWDLSLSLTWQECLYNRNSLRQWLDWFAFKSWLSWKSCLVKTLLG